MEQAGLGDAGALGGGVAAWSGWAVRSPAGGLAAALVVAVDGVCRARQGGCSSGDEPRRSRLGVTQPTPPRPGATPSSLLGRAECYLEQRAGSGSVLPRAACWVEQGVTSSSVLIKRRADRGEDGGRDRRDHHIGGLVAALVVAVDGSGRGAKVAAAQATNRAAPAERHPAIPARRHPKQRAGPSCVLGRAVCWVELCAGRAGSGGVLVGVVGGLGCGGWLGLAVAVKQVCRRDRASGSWDAGALGGGVARVCVGGFWEYGAGAARFVA